MNRKDWAIARESMRRQLDWRNHTCVEKGHNVVRIGPYFICRSLQCPNLVVGTV